MPSSMELIVFVLFFSERWSICYCFGLLYFSATRLYLIPNGIKKMILSLSIFNDQPLFKTIALKLFNHDYSKLKDSFEKPFCCKCGELSAPGVPPTPSDQGQTESCTLHAISKAMVSFMDKKKIDVKQDEVENVLLACLGTSDKQWPGQQVSMKKKFK